MKMSPEKKSFWLLIFMLSPGRKLEPADCGGATRPYRCGFHLHQPTRLEPDFFSSFFVFSDLRSCVGRAAAGTPANVRSQRWGACGNPAYLVVKGAALPSIQRRGRAEHFFHRGVAFRHT